MSRRCLVAAATTVGMLAFAGTASAATLGVTSPPAGSSPGGCSGLVIAQLTDDPSTPYFVPAGGGLITQWQTYTALDAPGSSVTFAVIRPTGGGNYTVVGADTETLPNPLPTNNVASFTLASPIQVAAGDTLALYTSTAANACYFSGGSTPVHDSLIALTDATPPPAAGHTLTQTGMTSPNGFTLNVAATISPIVDAGVQSSTYPSPTAPGGAALLSSTVTNGGPGTGPITFTDQVPNGLQIKSAAAGLGACTVSGQTVSCTISGLAAGQTAPVNVVVSPAAAGNYANNVSVAVGADATDPNPANNSASATLAVVAPPTPTTTTTVAPAQKCIAPRLRGTPSGVARTVLKELGCRVRLARKHSGVRKGSAIGVRGGAGTYPYQQLITLTVSSGPKKKKQHPVRHAPAVWPWRAL